jgi:hypothetical protein
MFRQLKMPFKFITALLNQASAQGSRSTVLRPLGWLLVICVAGLLACIEMKAPFWVFVLFAAMTALCFVLYLSAYIFCLLRDRDALRSETYSIQRLAIEKGFVGDSLAGVFDPRTVIDVSNPHKDIDSGEPQ